MTTCWLTSIAIFPTRRRIRTLKRRDVCRKCKKYCGSRAFRSLNFIRKAMRLSWRFPICALRGWSAAAPLPLLISFDLTEAEMWFRRAGRRGNGRSLQRAAWKKKKLNAEDRRRAEFAEKKRKTVKLKSLSL